MIHPVILGYYKSKKEGNYDLNELEEIVKEYGEEYILQLIRRACKKRRERKMAYFEDWNQPVKKAA